MDPKFITVFVMIVVAEAAVLLPLLRFLFTGWHSKRRDIVDGLNQKACLAYFKMFCRNSNVPAPDKACGKFFELYDRWYGQKKFIAPGILLFLTSLIAVTCVVFTMLDDLHFLKNPFIDLPIPAVAALSGAYMWVVDDLISRARRLDMAPSDLQWSTLRLIIAVPMGYAFSSIVIEEMAPFVTFALGAFPISTLTALLQRTANKALKNEATDLEMSDGIVKLQGTDRAIVERLEKEDLRTIIQMAYCDPVHTTMRSSLTFNFITDLMNQALVWIYLREDIQKIAPMGLRGAVEVKHFIENLDSSDPSPEAMTEKQLSQEALPKIAAALNQDPTTVQFTFRQIAADPYTCFLYEIWT